ncbi:MAG: hypothetical protein ACLSBB_10975 [Ruthenibacterium lactatiformans]
MFIVYAFLSTTTATSTVRFWGDGISWYASAQYWPVILTIVIFGNARAELGYLWQASGIDKGLYERQRLTVQIAKQINITLPLLKPMVILMLLMSIGKIFNSDFGLFYQVTLNQGLLTSTCKQSTPMYTGR